MGVFVIALLLTCTSPATNALAPTSTAFPRLSIAVNTQLDPKYSVFGSTSSGVTAIVNGTGLDVKTPTQLTLQTNIRILTLQPTFVALGKTGFLSFTTSPIGGGVQYVFLLPTNTSSIYILIHGTQGGSTFLWRFVFNVPFLSESGLSVPVDYTSTVTIPSGSEPSQLFDSLGGTLPGSAAFQVGSSSGNPSYTLNGAVSLMIVQSTLFVPVAIVVSAVAVVVFAIAALNLFPPARLVIGRVKARIVTLVRRPLDSIPKTAKPSIHLKEVFQPKKLLVLFLVCSIAMVSLAAFAGPDPRVKAYVIADPSSVPQIRNNLAAIAGSVLVVTPSDDYSDFSTMASVGMFNIVIISNYPTLGLPQVSEFVLGSLPDVPVIVVDSSAASSFVNQINALYPGRVTTIGSAANMSVPDQQLIAQLLTSNARSNVFGLHIGTTTFKLLLALEAVLSFALIFLGWAFLGSLISSSGLQSDIYSVTSYITSGIFVFVFSEIIYIVTSSLLAMPISLHAVLSGSHDITAVGLLGFGGGSTPRLAAGVIGILAGVALTSGGPKLERTELALVSGMAVFLLANPFSIGQYVYSALLLFVGNYSFGTAYTSSQSLKGFIYGVGSLLGGGVSPTYLMSAGKMLYFAGLVPLAYVRRMSRTTTTFLVLVAAVLIGDGGVRVGEMTPYKTVIAVIPGLVIGFAFAAAFIGLAAIEKYGRGNWRSKS